MKNRPSSEPILLASRRMSRKTRSTDADFAAPMTILMCSSAIQDDVSGERGYAGPMGFRQWLGRALLQLPPEPVHQLSEMRDGLVAWQNEIARMRAIARCLDDREARARSERKASAAEADFDEHAAAYELDRQRLLRRGYAVAHMALPPPPEINDDHPDVVEFEQKFAEYEVDDYLAGAPGDRPRRLQ